MPHYRCKQCGGLMEYDKTTNKGEMYKCEECGHKGYMKGMTETAPGGIDPSTFGL